MSSLKEERQEAAGEVWQHEASMEAVARHKDYEELCSRCGFPLSDYTIEIRHSGMYTAHVAGYCEQRLRARIRELERELAAAKKLTKDYKDILDDLFDHNECIPECDSYAHHPECPQVSAIGTMRSLKNRADEARAVAIEECKAACFVRQQDGSTYAYWPCINAIAAIAKLPPGQVVVPYARLVRWRQVIKYFEYEPWSNEADKMAGETVDELQAIIAARPK